MFKIISRSYARFVCQCAVLITCCVLGFNTFAQQTNTSHVDSLKISLQSASNTERIEIYKALFESYFPADLDQAYVIDQQLIDLSKSIGDTENYLFGLNELGGIYNLRGQFDSLFIVNQQLLKVALQHNNGRYTCKAYANLAIYYERTSSLDSAVFYNQKALNTKGIYKSYIVYNNLARVYARQNDFNQAIEAYKKAIAGAEDAGEKNVQAVIANNVGTLFGTIKNDSLAMYYFNKSIELKREIGDRRGELYALLNMVVRPNLDTTLYTNLLENGLQTARELPDDRFEAIFVSLLCELNHPNVDCPNELLTLYKRFKSEPSFEFPFVLQSLVRHYLGEGEFEEATTYAKTYLELANEQQSLDDQQIARSTLLEIYERTGNAQAYFETAQAYYAIKDSLDQQLNLSAFAFLEGELDKEKNERILSLNDSLEQKETSRNRIILLSISIAVLLGILLYNRTQLIKFQRTVISKEQESGKYLERMNSILKEQQEFKNRFYSNITHEFKTPLTVIQGSIQQLQLDQQFVQLRKEDQLLSKKFDAIQRNGNNLMELVTRFLDLSKLDEQVLTLDLTDGDLSAYVYYLSESFESLFAEHNISFELVGNEGSIETAFDQEKIKHIVSNLLSNAVKYTPNGGRVTLSLTADAETYQIKVTDNGEGIPSDQVPLVFDRYYRVQSTNNVEGTGIGLSLCKELTEFMEGTISASSVVGEGSIFTVTLPLMAKNGLSTVLQENEDSISIEGNEHQPHVLIVEDNQEVARFMVSCIEKEYRYTVTSNGIQGIEAAQKLIPDLIITDVSMPGKDGFQVCEEVKQNELTSHIPIIMLTAKSSHDSKLKGLEKGADEFLAKPFDLRELLLRIQNLIDLRSSIRNHFQDSDTVRQTPKGANSVDQAFFEKVYDIIESNLQNSQLGVDFVATSIGISPAHLNRKLKSITNLSTNKFILTHKLKHAKQLLSDSDAHVSEVAYESGFNSVAYFIKCFREAYGVTPGTWKSQD